MCGGGGGFGFYAKFSLHMAYDISNVNALRIRLLKESLGYSFYLTQVQYHFQMILIVVGFIIYVNINMRSVEDSLIFLKLRTFY